MLSPGRANRQGGTRPSGPRTISCSALNGRGQSAVEKANRTVPEFLIECFEPNIAVYAAEFPFRCALTGSECLERFDATFFDPIFSKITDDVSLHSLGIQVDFGRARQNGAYSTVGNCEIK